MDLDKNNTSYPTLLDEYIKNIEKDDILFDYQNIVYNYISKQNNRGLLVFHGLGSGKTITSISIAEYFRKKERDIMILSSKSLKLNYIKEIENYNKKINNDITQDELDNIVQKYKFITMNASNMIKQLQNKNNELDEILYEINKFNLDNKVIIVDEAHNLFNSIVNGSKNANEFYELIMKSKNIKLLLLTGSPIVNNFFEIVPALNMCAGFPILPEYYSDFKQLFIDEKTNSIKNKIKLQSRILGLVSYHGSLFTEKYYPFIKSLKMSSPEKENFPTKLPIKIEKVEMSKIQNAEYIKLRDIEKKENSRFIGGKIINEQSSVSTSYRIRTRQISNIYLTKTKLTKDNIDIYCPKFIKIYDNIKQHKKQLGIIYSAFIVNGLEAFANFLELYGYSNYSINKKEYMTYALYTGNQTLEEKEEIINTYNNKNNIDGKYISLLLISSAGAEGLDLKNTRHVHIMEPYWNYSRINQVEARAIRYKSHEDLPKSEKNVSVYIYLSIFNNEYIDEQKDKINKIIENAKKNNLTIKKKDLEIDKPTDIYLFEKSIRAKELNDKILEILAEVSIECQQFNKEINFKCFSCIPTNEKLYYKDIQIDIDIPTKCEQPEKITTEEVILNGNKYYYDKSNPNNIYYFDEKVDGYIQLDDLNIIKKINDKI